MKVELQAPEEFQGTAIGLLNQRRGVILSSEGQTSTSSRKPTFVLGMFGFYLDGASLGDARQG